MFERYELLTLRRNIWGQLAQKQVNMRWAHAEELGTYTSLMNGRLWQLSTFTRSCYDLLVAPSAVISAISGGSFGTGKRANFLSMFHVGVGVRDADNPHAPPRVFKSFCRIGSGYTNAELLQVRVDAVRFWCLRCIDEVAAAAVLLTTLSASCLWHLVDFSLQKKSRNMFLMQRVWTVVKTAVKNWIYYTQKN